MNVITVSREYGAGGLAVARRLAEALGWELLDRELLLRAAAIENLSDAELEQIDEQPVGLLGRLRRNPLHLRYMHGLTEAAHQAAARGRVVLVGRGTGHLLRHLPDVFSLRLVAPRDLRVQRMMEREGLSAEAALARCVVVDRSRERFNRYFFGPDATRPWQYDCTINTGRVPLDDVVAVVLALVRGQEHLAECHGCDSRGTQRRVLTLSREMGAGDTGFGPTLGARLGLKVYDRELLEQQAVRMGVSERELARIDEQAGGLFKGFLPNSIYQRYFEALGQLMKELAERGAVLVVGRGGSRFLRDDPRAFHLRLTAPLEVRVRRVMEHRWLREEAARLLVARVNDQRRHFYQEYFGADWYDPLEYHATINSGRLGPAAIDVAVLAAERHWQTASS
jgi:cytidylate kinase